MHRAELTAVLNELAVEERRVTHLIQKWDEQRAALFARESRLLNLRADRDSLLAENAALKGSLEELRGAHASLRGEYERLRRRHDADLAPKQESWPATTTGAAAEGIAVHWHELLRRLDLGLARLDLEKMGGVTVPAPRARTEAERAGSSSSQPETTPRASVGAALPVVVEAVALVETGTGEREDEGVPPSDSRAATPCAHWSAPRGQAREHETPEGAFRRRGLPEESRGPVADSSASGPHKEPKAAPAATAAATAGVVQDATQESEAASFRDRAHEGSARPNARAQVRSLRQRFEALPSTRAPERQALVPVARASESTSPEGLRPAPLTAHAIRTPSPMPTVTTPREHASATGDWRSTTDPSQPAYWRERMAAQLKQQLPASLVKVAQASGGEGAAAAGTGSPVIATRRTKGGLTPCAAAKIATARSTMRAALRTLSWGEDSNPSQAVSKGVAGITGGAQRHYWSPAEALRTANDYGACRLAELNCVLSMLQDADREVRVLRRALATALADQGSEDDATRTTTGVSRLHALPTCSGSGSLKVRLAN